MKKIVLIIIGSLLISTSYSQTQWYYDTPTHINSTSNNPVLLVPALDATLTNQWDLAIGTSSIERIRIFSTGEFHFGDPGTASSSCLFNSNVFFDINAPLNGIYSTSFRVAAPCLATQNNIEFSALSNYTDPNNNTYWTALFAKNGNADYAGYFDGNVRMEGNASIGNMPVGTTQPSATLDIFGNNSVTKNFRVTIPGNTNFNSTEFSALTNLGNNIWTGLYSNAGGQKYSGYFDGDVNINGKLGFGNNSAANPIASLCTNTTSDLSISTSGSERMRIYNNGDIKFGPQNSEFLRILNTGEISINTSSCVTNLAALDINAWKVGTNESNFKVRELFCGGSGSTNTTGLSGGTTPPDPIGNGTEFSALTNFSINSNSYWTAMYAKNGNADYAGYFDGNVNIIGNKGNGGDRNFKVTYQPGITLTGTEFSACIHPTNGIFANNPT